MKNNAAKRICILSALGLISLLLTFKFVKGYYPFPLAVRKIYWSYQNKQKELKPAMISENFVIHSEMDHRYIKILQSNMEAFYNKIRPDYFITGWKEPLDIYYSEKQSDTQRLIARFGYKDRVHYGVYLSYVPAIFTHHLMDDGGRSGLGTIFHEITHRLVELNYRHSPTWFNEGLATFLGEQTRVVGDKLTLGQPNPWRERILQTMLEHGGQIDVKRLSSLTTRQFYKQSDNYHPTRALFYWIYENGYLKSYLENVKKDGYALSVLEKTVNKPYQQINEELLTFIKTHCYPAAHYQSGLLANDMAVKKKCFQEALGIKPDYQSAELELARCFYQDGSYEKCRQYLEPILKDASSPKFAEALILTADSYYNEKAYARAVQYYERAWDCLDYDEYKYLITLQIAGCYHFLGETEAARQWYGKFLDENWEPTRLPELVNYARQYLRPAETQQ
jgi:hypothetical protein